MYLCNMGRIMGIDFGLKRIGIAISDPLNMFAQPLDTILTSEFPKWIKEYILNNLIDSFVVGMPKNLKGEDTHATQPTLQFIEWLNSEYSNIPVHIIDERLSSREAQNEVLKMGVPKNKRREKGRIDNVAATLILKTYLDTKN